MRRNGLTKYDAPLRIQFSGAMKHLKNTQERKGVNVVYTISWIAVWTITLCSIVSGKGAGILRTLKARRN